MAVRCCLVNLVYIYNVNIVIIEFTIVCAFDVLNINRVINFFILIKNSKNNKLKRNSIRFTP